MRFYENISELRIGLHLILRDIVLASFVIIIQGSLLADTVPLSRLNRNVTITLGTRQIVLASGTAVTVLSQESENAVISFKLSDSTPVITRIPATSLTVFSVAKVATLGGPRATDHSNDDSTISSSTGSKTIPTNSGPTFSNDILVPNADPNPEQIRPAKSVTLSSLDIALPQPRFTALNGSFYIEIHGQPVRVVYSLPMEDEHLAKSASNLVFYGPYPNEQTELKGNIVPDIVTKLGCAVFSLSFSQGGDDLFDPNTAYWSKSSGWFEAVMLARDEIIKGFALDRKKLLLLGYSGGGGMVLNLAGAFPDQVDAVAAQGASLAPTLEEKNSISWFIVNNRGEANAAITIPFYKRLKDLGCSALYCETTPERGRGRYHSPSAQAFNLIYTFLAGIIEQRKRLEEGSQDIAQLWPYASESDPLKRYAVIKTLTIDDPQAARIHFDLLPSAAFAWNWCKVCPPIQTVNLSQSGYSSRLHINFPASDKPIGIVLYYDKSDYQYVARQVEDICSLAEHGCIVISPAFGMSPERFTQVASDWIISQNNLASMPIHVAGYGSEGARFLAAMNDQTRISCKSVTLIGFDCFPISKELNDKIEALAKSCGLYSFFSCQKTVDATPLSALSQDLDTIQSRARGCQNIIVKADVDTDESKSNIEEQALDVIKQTVDNSCGKITSQVPALWLEKPVIPDTATANNQVDITVHVRDRGIYGQRGFVQLKSLDKVLSTVQLDFFFDGDQEVTLSYTPTDRGEIPLELVISSTAQDSSVASSRLINKIVVK